MNTEQVHKCVSTVRVVADSIERDGLDDLLFVTSDCECGRVYWIKIAKRFAGDLAVGLPVTVRHLFRCISIEAT